MELGRRGTVRTAAEVSIEVPAGETVALAGESGRRADPAGRGRPRRGPLGRHRRGRPGGEKRLDCARLPGLRRHVLVEQDRAAATLLERTAEGWAEAEVADEDGAVALPEVGAELPLAGLFRGVSLPRPADPGAAAD